MDPKSFLDDPSFQASLSALDRGLSGVEPGEEVLPSPRAPSHVQSGAPPSLAPGAPGASAAPSGPAMPPIFPESAFIPQLPAPVTRFGRAAIEALEAQSAPAAVSEPAGLPLGAPGAPRQLLDLFPPPPVRGHPTAGSGHPDRHAEGRARGPAMAMGDAPPPRIDRSRFAGQLETAPFAPAAPLTYEPFYGLAEKPFSLSTDPKFIYHSTSHDRVVQELIDALGRGDGIMMLTGEMGIGKTTLCRSLVEQLGRRTVTSLITDPVASFGDLLKTVLVDFGVVARVDATRGRLATATRQELAAAVGDFAASLVPLQASAVIIIDEAQNVPVDVLDPLSALADGPGGDRRVQIILVGQPTLPPLLHRPELRSVERRVAVRSRLEPLTPDETIGYVVHRLAVAGRSARVEFDEAALAELHAATRGVPQFINLVCDLALTRGHEASASVIDEAMIVSAAADLDLAALTSDGRWMAQMARVVASAVVFAVLVLAGAGAAAWVFRDEVSRLVTEWERVPPLPAAPVQPGAEPVAPPLPPAP